MNHPSAIAYGTLILNIDEHELEESRAEAEALGEPLDETCVTYSATFAHGYRIEVWTHDGAHWKAELGNEKLDQQLIAEGDRAESALGLLFQRLAYLHLVLKDFARGPHDQPLFTSEASLLPPVEAL